MHPLFTERGLLPVHDPAPSFAPGSELSVLDEIGRDLPSLLEDSGFRRYVRRLRIPEWPDDRLREETGTRCTTGSASMRAARSLWATLILTDMRRFMPLEHRQLIAEVEALPPVWDLADPQAYNEVLEAMATFRKVHYTWAQEYVRRWVDDPRGTGGAPYIVWLRQLIDETRLHKLPG